MRKDYFIVHVGTSLLVEPRWLIDRSVAKRFLHGHTYHSSRLQAMPSTAFRGVEVNGRAAEADRPASGLWVIENQ